MSRTLLFVALVSACLGSPLPQDPNDDAEVFSGPVRGGDYDDDYGFFLPRPRVRILVVPVSRDSSDYDDSDSSAPGLFSILRSIIASRLPQTDENSEDDKPCFLCSIFEDSLKNVRNHINNVRDRENEVDISYGDDEGLDINNSTHTTKVLDDGSVVHINKTTIADTDEDGNSFFFHRAVIHNIGSGADDDDDNVDEDNVAEEIVEAVADDEEVEEDEDTDAGVDAGLLDL